MHHAQKSQPQIGLAFDELLPDEIMHFALFQRYHEQPLLPL